MNLNLHSCETLLLSTSISKPILSTIDETPFPLLQQQQQKKDFEVGEV